MSTTKRAAKNKPWLNNPAWLAQSAANQARYLEVEAANKAAFAEEMACGFVLRNAWLADTRVAMPVTFVREVPEMWTRSAK